MVIVEVGGWKEDGPGDFWVHDDTVAIKPPSIYCQIRMPAFGDSTDLHYPVGPFGCRLGQLDHYERLQVSRLVEKRVVLIQSVAKHMRRNSPSIAMLSMGLDASLVDPSEFILVPLIQHGCLAYTQALIAFVEIIRTILKTRVCP